MITKIKEIPMRAFVSAQTFTLTRTEDARQSPLASHVVPQTTRDRAALALGAVIAMVASSLTAQSYAATEKYSGFAGVVNTFTQFAFYVLAAGSFIMALFAALMFVTAGGNPKMVGRAKDTIKYVVIGIVLMAAFKVAREVIFTIADPGTSNDSGVKGGLQKGQDAAQSSAVLGK